MDYFFSVVIPTLNEELFIKSLLASLAVQNKKNFEVLVVDASSKDKTKEIVLSFKDRLDLKFLTSPKVNVSHQKNLGAAAARGKYLFFIDADMSLGKSFMRHAEKQIVEKKGLVFIPYLHPLGNHEFKDIRIIYPMINKLVEFSQSLTKPFSGGPAMIWEKGVFQLVEGFEDVFAEDHQIIRKAHEWGIRPKFIRNSKIFFSLRRLKREGRLVLFYKFLSTQLYLLFNNEIKKSFFQYDMGGHLYKDKSGKSKSGGELLIDTKEIVKKIKKVIDRIVQE